MNREFLLLRIPLLYLLFGILWILSSDIFLGRYLSPAHWLNAGIAKGLIFVVVSSAFIFLLLYYEWRQRKAAMGLLHRSESRFSTYFQLSPLPTIIISLVDNSFLEANQAFCEQTGFTRTQLIGRSVAEVDSFLQPEERNRLLQLLEKNNSVENFPTQLRGRNDEVRDILVAAEVIELEGTRCLLAILNDITELREAEAKLVANENLLQTLFTAIPVMLAFIDHTGLWYMVNHEWIRVTGWSAKELQNGDALSLLAPDEEQTTLLRHHLEGDTRS